MAKQNPDELELLSSIGFSGTAPCSLHAHPDQAHLVYPLGCNIVIERIAGKRQQRFLQGHDNEVTCVAVSPSGKYVASGQKTHVGYKADIIVWDFATGDIVQRLSLHKERINAVSFSASEAFLASVGGGEDNTLALWNIATGKAVGASEASSAGSGPANAVQFAGSNDNVLVTGGDHNLRIWDVHPHSRALLPSNVSLNGIKRVVTSIVVGRDDVAYCGTTSGDVLLVTLQHKILKSTFPQKKKFVGGVRSLLQLPTGDIVVGGGDGTVALMSNGGRFLKTTQLQGAVTSLSSLASAGAVFVGTDTPSIHTVDLSSFNDEMRSVGHAACVNDVKFPPASSELFGTCSTGGIRIWHTPTGKLLLDIKVPNVECNCIEFHPEGNLIFSGWSDGAVRAFTPESGKLSFIIQNANQNGVTALAVCTSARTLVTGGGDGQIRIWTLGRSTQQLETTLKEHKAAVTDIQIKHDDTEAVSASLDGSCIVWDLKRHMREKILFANTMFYQARYRPDEAQLITCGSDRKVQYWECFDGSLIREVELDAVGALTAMDMSVDGNHFVVGGDSRLLKVVSYNECIPSHVGRGHSGRIVSAAICPNQRYIVSVTATGGIFRWLYPYQLQSS